MSTLHGATKPTNIEQEESVILNGVRGKRTILAGYDGANINDAYVDSTGKLRVDVDMATEGIATEATLAKLRENPDTTFTWVSGNPTQIVEVYSDRTVTSDLTWVNGVPTVIDVTVT